LQTIVGVRGKRLADDRFHRPSHLENSSIDSRERNPLDNSHGNHGRIHNSILSTLHSLRFHISSTTCTPYKPKDNRDADYSRFETPRCLLFLGSVECRSDALAFHIQNTSNTKPLPPLPFLHHRRRHFLHASDSIRKKHP
uniref:Ovule protein n=1 Tax=Rodentolepis nana TaxID=102285 RepID=A0A0R3TY77_RODNA